MNRVVMALYGLSVVSESRGQWPMFPLCVDYGHFGVGIGHVDRLCRLISWEKYKGNTAVQETKK